MDKEEVLREAERAIREAWTAHYAAHLAKERASMAILDLNIAVFLFTIVASTIFLLYQGVRIEIVAPMAFCGLAISCLTRWRRGRQLYQRLYAAELSRLEQCGNEGS